MRRYEIVDIELGIYRRATHPTTLNFPNYQLPITNYQLPITNLIGKTYLEAARTNNNPPIPKPNAIGNQADIIGVKTAFTPIELVMKPNT